MRADELVELNITPTELPPPDRGAGQPLSQIIRGKRSITGDTALRLGHWFATSPQFWLNLQATYDIRVAEAVVGAEISGCRFAVGTKSGLVFDYVGRTYPTCSSDHTGMALLEAEPRLVLPRNGVHVTCPLFSSLQANRQRDLRLDRHQCLRISTQDVVVEIRVLWSFDRND